MLVSNPLNSEGGLGSLDMTLLLTSDAGEVAGGVCSSIFGKQPFLIPGAEILSMSFLTKPQSLSSTKSVTLDMPFCPSVPMSPHL